MAWEIAALILTVVAHIVGGLALVVAMLDGKPADWSSLRPRDDDPGDGGPGIPDSTPPDDDPGGIGAVPPAPLPDAGQSPRRLRQPRPARRPQRTRRRETEPQPERPRVPQQRR